MRFKRPSVRYSTATEPVTPYQSAQQQWDERLGSSRVQAANWRLMAFGNLVVTASAVGILVWQTGRSSITPYVVEVDRRGDAHAVGPALEAYQPTDAQIEYQLEHFIRNVRSLPLDPIVLRQQWLEAYDYATDRAAATLNAYARTNDPFARVGHASIAVEVASVVRASPNSFQVRWVEHAYVDGSPGASEHWTAILSIVLQPPRDAERLRHNPLGIYVDGLDWSRELGSG
jgi:type IV secretion system protein TrbF